MAPIRVTRMSGWWTEHRPGKTDRTSSGTAGYLSVWSSISAVGALRLTDSMPLIALALLS